MKTWNLAYFVDQQYIVTVQASEHCGVTFILTHFILCILILSFPCCCPTTFCVLAADWSVVRACFPASCFHVSCFINTISLISYLWSLDSCI